MTLFINVRFTRLGWWGFQRLTIFVLVIAGLAALSDAAQSAPPVETAPGSAPRNATDSQREGTVTGDARQSGNLFRVFREVPFDKMKAVVVGLSPYNVIVNNREVADGIALSCSNTGKEQPSLTQWYNAMEKEFGKDIVRDPDLSYLCQEGVLMYNYSMTAGWKDATGHLIVWEWFSNELFRTAMSEAGVPVITLGKEAAKVLEHCAPWMKTIALKHPASASYSKTDWNSEGAFKDVQDYLAVKGVKLNWVKFKDKF